MGNLPTDLAEIQRQIAEIRKLARKCPLDKAEVILWIADRLENRAREIDAMARHARTDRAEALRMQMGYSTALPHPEIFIPSMMLTARFSMADNRDYPHHRPSRGHYR